MTSPPPGAPRPSWRKPAAAFLIITLIAGWAVFVATLLAGPAGRLPAWGQAVFYVGAGIVWIWILPLRRILLWSETGRWTR